VGTSLDLLRIPADQAVADGSALLAMFTFGDVGRTAELYRTRQLTGIDTAWMWLEPVYTGAAPNWGSPSTLVISGGEGVETGEIPVQVLPAHQVREVADYLRDIDFEACLARNKSAAEAAYGDEFGPDVIVELRGFHADLAAFYQEAAAAGDAVVKYQAW
jgi:hypothetical protein